MSDYEYISVKQQEEEENRAYGLGDYAKPHRPASIPLEEIATPQTEPRRDRYGRYLVTNPDGTLEAYTRATTIAKTLEDQYNLTQWSLRKAIKGIATRNDLITSAQAHDPDDDRELYKGLVEQALEAAGSKSAATLGTALHRFTEDVDAQRKTIDQVPDEWRNTVALYQQTIHDHKIVIHPEHIEQVLLFDNYKIAGTADRVVTLADGRHVIADLKTSKNMDFGWLGFGIQLAIYANHTATFDYTRNTRGKRINVDTSTGLIIHLPSQGPQHGTCALYEIDLEAGYEALLCAIEARQHRAAARKWGAIHNPGGPRGYIRPSKPPVDIRAACVEWLEERIRAAATRPDALTDLIDTWPPELPQPFPKTATPEQINQLAAVLSDVEAKHGIPFGPPRPGGEPRLTNQKAKRKKLTK